jgi:protein-S-isoprenylcysteine O-methyltransferase Ste14
MSKVRRILEHQPAHLAWLLALLLGMLGASRLPGFSQGEFLGVSTRTWVLLSVANAVVHQVFVWICWRTELYSQLLTRVLGKAAFASYAVVFAVLILARPVFVTALAISNADTLPVDPMLAGVLGVVLVAPAAWLLYSVRRYFGFERAFGIDHFDSSCRSLPRVREGIFRFTPNAMYVFGFLVLWIPGLLLRSTAAIAVALFSHLYIWVHYSCTEKPDMQQIYGPNEGGVDAI